MRRPRSDQQQLRRAGELMASLDDRHMSFEIRMDRARPASEGRGTVGVRRRPHHKRGDSVCMDLSGNSIY